MRHLDEDWKKVKEIAVCISKGTVCGMRKPWGWNVPGVIWKNEEAHVTIREWAAGKRGEEELRYVLVNKQIIQDLADRCKHFGFYSEQGGRTGRRNSPSITWADFCFERKLCRHVYKKGRKDGTLEE